MENNRWEIPDEYRIWKEQMDEIEKKKKSGGSQSMPALKRVESNPTLPQNNNNNSNQNNYQSSTTTGISQGNKATSQTTKDNQKVVNTVVYATAAEAIEAFKQLLTDKHISTLAKMKEVQDHCSHDPRWEALKTTGEKKQALAEYQVSPPSPLPLL